MAPAFQCQYQSPVRLLNGRDALLAAIGLAACVVVLAFVGPLIAWLVAVSAAAALYTGRRNLTVADAEAPLG